MPRFAVGNDVLHGVLMAIEVCENEHRFEKTPPPNNPTAGGACTISSALVLHDAVDRTHHPAFDHVEVCRVFTLLVDLGVEKPYVDNRVDTIAEDSL